VAALVPIGTFPRRLWAHRSASVFRARLLAMLQGRGMENVQQAEQFASSGNRGRARIRLRHAERGLADFERLLKSRRGRKAIPQSRGQPLADDARAVRNAIGGLTASL
jgi:hypothetical protein